MPIQIFANKYVVLSMIFLGAISAILFTSALENLFIEENFNGWVIMGIALLILAVMPIVATMDFLKWHWWTVFGIGIVLIIIGYIIGG